jgi:hypothetical protein
MTRTPLHGPGTLAVTVLLALVLAACGSSGDGASTKPATPPSSAGASSDDGSASATPSPTSLSPDAGTGTATPSSAAAFRTAANAICKAASRKMDSLDPGSNPSAAQLDAAYAKLAGLIDGEVVALRALTPPEDLRDDVTALLDAVSRVAATVRAKGHLMATEDHNPFDGANTRATALGLDTCAAS